jgi:hypothetical protein
MSLRWPAALALAALASGSACERAHSVQIKLGSDDGMLGLGFRCVDDQGALLFGRAVASGRLEFSIVVDLIGVGDTVPGCRGEEIIRACPREQECPTLVVSPDGRRACVPFSIPPPFDDPAVVVPQVLAALHGLVLTDDAPDRPVIVRAVATTERCDDRLVAPQNDTYPLLDPTRAIGCAYSCPLQLDTVDAISLYLDALDEHCEEQVRACAAFPRRAL